MLKCFEKNKEKWIFLGLAFAVFCVLRYSVLFAAPFILGAALAVAIAPVTCFLNQKLRVNKGIAAIIVITVLIAVLLIVLGCCGYGILGKGSEIFGNYENYLLVVTDRAEVCCDFIEKRLSLKPGYLMTQARGAMADFEGHVNEKLIPEMFAGSVSGLKVFFKVGAFFLFVILSAVFITKEWDIYTQGNLFGIKKYVVRVAEFVKVFLWAQIRIIGIIALIAWIGFSLAKIDGAAGVAIFTAFMDVLPFIGTGIVIMPMVLWKLLIAQYYQAFFLLGTYICCMIAREYLEPKFISAKIGVSPILTLLGIYVGVQVLGIFGIFLGPLYVVLLRILYEEIVKKKEHERTKDNGNQEEAV